MASILNNEMEFNDFCHAMAKSNWPSAYNYITDIFNNSVGYKDKCNKVIKASLLTVRGDPLYISFVNRITQLALRVLSPEPTKEFIESPSCFGEEELKIRYSAEVFLSYFPQGSRTPGSFNQLNREGEEDGVFDERELWRSLVPLKVLRIFKRHYKIQVDLLQNRIKKKSSRCPLFSWN